MKGLYIVGTDTGVGKTFAAASLTRALHQRGRMVSVMKPFESGVDTTDTLHEPADRQRLWQATGRKGAMPDWVCPYHFDAPLAPGVAARKAGIAVDLSRIDRAFAAARENADFLIVEGAGGLLAPLLPDNFSYTNEDLAVRLGLPILIVARLALGTINHTRLCLQYLLDRKRPVCGILLNQDQAHQDPSAADNPLVLREVSEVPVWGPLPFQNLPESTANTALLPMLADLEKQGRL